MAKIIFVTQDGAEYAVEAASGSSAMENAVRNDVPGIDADCGGACACATCHVYVEAPWFEVLGEPSEMEADMLDFASELRANSRLSCQIRIRDDLDGLRLGIPERQG